MNKLTIITVSYNSAKTIRETIECVLSQNYPNIEYIIIDGQSSDGTQAIIRSYGSKISKFITEADSGLYEAMNKGIEHSTGDVIGILNSDDLYSNTDVLSVVMREFSENGPDCVFGDLIYFASNNPEKVVRKYSGNNFKPYKVRIGILPPHPTFFVKREVYQVVGTFDLEFRFAADFDLMARILYVHNRTFSYIPLTMVKMRMGGISTSSLKRLIEINREDIRSCRKNGIKTNLVVFYLKYLIKVFDIRSLMGMMTNHF